MSIHVWKAQEKARKMGAFAGNEAAADLWNMSKRELIEVALRLTKEEDVIEAAASVREERDILRRNGII